VKGVQGVRVDQLVAVHFAGVRVADRDGTDARPCWVFGFFPRRAGVGFFKRRVRFPVSVRCGSETVDAFGVGFHDRGRGVFVETRVPQLASQPEARCVAGPGPDAFKRPSKPVVARVFPHYAGPGRLRSVRDSGDRLSGRLRVDRFGT